MDPKSLPAKAARDTPHEPILRDAPHKPDREGAHLAAERSAMPGKAEFKESEAAKAASREHSTREPVDQQPPSYGGPAVSLGGGGGDYYLRLTVRVDHGALSIVDSHPVAGPLAQTTSFHGPYAYEVTDGGRLLHAGSIADLGTVRAFADMDGTPEQHRHHTYQLDTYEFDVRVPAAALREAALSNVAIVLHRVKAPDEIATPVATLAAAPLAVQRSETFREIGRVVGIPAHLLTPDLQRDEPPPTAERTRGVKQRPQGGDANEDGGETAE